MSLRLVGAGPGYEVKGRSSSGRARGTDDAGQRDAVFVGDPLGHRLDGLGGRAVQTLLGHRRRRTPFRRPPVPDGGFDLGLRRMDGGGVPSIPPSVPITSPLVSALLRESCWILTLTKPLVDAYLGRRGAGGNRTRRCHQVSGLLTDYRPSVRPISSVLERPGAARNDM